MRNVEIKARVRDLASLVGKAQLITDKPCEKIKQHDTFYNIPNGRLKLRKFEDGASELIYYERDDTEGPKLSSYNKVNIQRTGTNPLNTLLQRALGVKGIVKKTRQLFMVGQTRIHVDSVEELGDFMELEVTLTPNEKTEDGIKIAHGLMEQLGVDKADLIAGAYQDLLQKERK